MALGYIAAFSETLALAVIAEKGLAPLCAAVAEEREDHLCAAAAWSVGQIGRHTPDHAKAVADTGVLHCFICVVPLAKSSSSLHMHPSNALCGHKDTAQ